MCPRAHPLEEADGSGNEVTVNDSPRVYAFARTGLENDPDGFVSTDAPYACDAEWCERE